MADESHDVQVLEEEQPEQPGMVVVQDRHVPAERYVPTAHTHTLPERTNGLEQDEHTDVEEQAVQPTRLAVQATQLVIVVAGSRVLPGLQTHTPPERVNSSVVSQLVQLAGPLQLWQPVEQLKQVEPLWYLAGWHTHTEEDSWKPEAESQVVHDVPLAQS